MIPATLAQARLPAKVLVVYAVLALGCILPVLLTTRIEEAKGFFLLTLLSGLLYTSVLIVTVWHHLSENGWRFAGSLKDGILQAGLILSTITFMSTALVQKSAESVYALALGIEPIHLVQLETRVAGAGSGAAGTINYKFGFSWGRPIVGPIQEEP